MPQLSVELVTVARAGRQRAERYRWQSLQAVAAGRDLAGKPQGLESERCSALAQDPLVIPAAVIERLDETLDHRPWNRPPATIKTAATPLTGPKVSEPYSP